MALQSQVLRSAASREDKGGQSPFRFGWRALRSRVVRLLIAEDDEGIRVPLVRALEREGYDVDAYGEGEVATARGVDGDHDLVIIDVGLPGVDGLEMCRRIRAVRPAVPIVFLTAQDGELDVINGLDSGADDYITKPFRIPELLARIRAHLRRNATARVEAGRIRVDLAARRAWNGEDEVDLSRKEFDLLALLVREAGRVVTRERIMAEVWDENWFGSTKTLDMHVSWLRRKLGDDAADPRHIVTVRGVGLRFEP
jgi:DNA-binding response OmpR family regulator